MIDDIELPGRPDGRVATPMTTRSRVVLEIASELVAIRSQPYNQAKVSLRIQGAQDWPLTLFGSSTVEGIFEVVAGRAAMAIVNPATALAAAALGLRPFVTPQPVRAIAVIPSLDQYVLAVRPETNLGAFEEIAEKKSPLRIALRGQLDHWLHYMLEDVANAAGFSVADIVSWGGEAKREGQLPYPHQRKFQAFLRGEIDAVFDEAADVWLGEALDAGMKVLSLSEATVQTLERRGYRRAWLRKADYPRLPRDVLTLDFSGWPIFVHKNAPDELVSQICAALVARKHLIPWQGAGDLPVERMCLDAPDTPQLVALHPAAERFWRSRGYID
jgi:hypothetical protein